MQQHLITAPDEVRQFRYPWLEGVSEAVQELVRFQAQVFRGNVLAEYMTGDAGTMKIGKQKPEIMEEFNRVREQHCFKKVRDPQAEWRLQQLLGERGVALRLRDRVPIPDIVLDLTHRIYQILPPEHFGGNHFTQLSMGFWGQRDVLGSEYMEGAVSMYPFSYQGPVRNFVGLLLHETGHAHEQLLRHKDQEAYGDLTQCFLDLGKDGLLTVDFLTGPDNRAAHIWRHGANEFAAETYLMYVALGDSFMKGIKALEPKLRKPYEKVYEIFKKSFGGREYK